MIQRNSRSVDDTMFIKVKLATLVEVGQKAPFSIDTTPRWREERYFFPWLLHFTLDPHLIMLSVQQGNIKYHFWVFGMTWPCIEPRFPGPLANTLTSMPVREKERFLLTGDTTIEECVHKKFCKHLFTFFDSWSSFLESLVIIQYSWIFAYLFSVIV